MNNYSTNKIKFNCFDFVKTIEKIQNYYNTTTQQKSRENLKNFAQNNNHKIIMFVQNTQQIIDIIDRNLK